MTEPSVGSSSDRIWSSPVLDAVDKHVISLLQRDGRAPYSDIAREVGISDAAVRRRVQRLLDDGVMQIVAVTDPLQLGFAREALVGIRSSSDTMLLADALAEIEEVDFVVLCSGPYDLLLEVVAESDDAFLAIVARIRGVVGSGEVRVLPYLRTWKQEYSWGTR